MGSFPPGNLANGAIYYLTEFYDIFILGVKRADLTSAFTIFTKANQDAYIPWFEIAGRRFEI